jgi:hypothetical protein
MHKIIVSNKAANYEILMIKAKLFLKSQYSFLSLLAIGYWLLAIG